MGTHFEGKVAMVTGGGAGIGRAAALAFARAGARLVVAEVSPQTGEETVGLVRRAGGEAIAVRADVSRPADVAGMVDAALRAFGRLDIAFNNAGIEGVQAATADYPIEAWDRVLAVNLTGVWLCMKEEIVRMRAQGGGAIVNNASILGTVAFANASAYAAAKHGVLGLTKTAALEYATQGIRVNAVCPGFIATPMLERAGFTANKPLLEAVVGLHPMKRLGAAEEVAEAAVWLASDAASFVTGVALHVDGGYVAQ